MQKKYIKVFRSKTKDYHTYICSEERLKYLRKIRTEIEVAFFNFKTLNGEYATKSYTQFINNQLRLAQEALGLYYTHSFRIGRVPHWLQGYIPLQNVQKLIGHKGIQRTAKYDRWDLFDIETLEQIKTLDKQANQRSK